MNPRLLILSCLIFWAYECQLRGREPDFARDVRPILSQHCFKCHGPDEKSRQGNLRLDQRSSALTGGDSQLAAIVPGSAEKSELMKRITSHDPDAMMPPPSTKRVLTSEQIETLRQWIDSQAVYTEHWAFQPIADPLIPQAAAPANTPIDAFINSAAQQHDLMLEGPADPATWLRRLYLDVLGIPPTYAQVQDFIDDHRPDARERIIDRVLSAPSFGERWGRRWLDIARYADTNGYEKDRPRSIWPYRDWVIRALNDDMPQNQFAIEQLAGDLLPQATQSQIIATGFHRNTMINEEGGIDPLEYRFYAMVDRVNTTSTAWLGMTMACAQCHDHKYDPISQRDYYGVMALLNNAEEPELEVFDADTAAAQREVDSQIDELKRSRIQNFALPADLLKTQPASVRSVKSDKGLTWELSDTRWISKGAPPKMDTTQIELDLSAATRPDQTLLAVRLKAIGSSESADGALGWSESKNFVITHTELIADGRQVTIGSASASFEQPGYTASASIDADAKSGWAVAGHGDKVCEITWQLAQPLSCNTTSSLKLALHQQFGSSHLLRGFELSLDFAETDQPLERIRLKHAMQSFREWIQATAQTTGNWNLIRPTEVHANMAKLVLQEDGSYLAIGDITKRDEYVLDIDRLSAGTTALMIEALPDPSMPKRGPGRTYYEGPIGDFFLSEVSLLRPDESKLKIKDALVDFALAGREAEKVLDGDPLTGWSIDGRQGQTHRLIIRLEEPLPAESSVSLKLLFERYYAAPIGRVKVWSTTATKLDDAAAKLAPEIQSRLSSLKLEEVKLDGTLPAEQSLNVNYAKLLRDDELGEAFLDQSPELAGVNAQIKTLSDRRAKFNTTLVMSPRPEGFVRPTNRYHRGEFLNPRETVEPAVPEFLKRVTGQPPRDRLELARWLFAPAHPLTARVLANRYWSNLMGRGLVNTEEDFGFQGSFPSNQALLDWLASELVGQRASQGEEQFMWSFKRWLRLVLSSDAYARASTVSSHNAQRDPGNIFLARANRRRLDAEQARDASLVAAGLLSQTMGGPSVYPPQPASITTEGTYGKLSWPESHGADRYRRSLYTFTKRTAPFAMLATFDAPSGEACVARRESTDTPLQALTMLNDTIFMEAAQELAYRTVKERSSNGPQTVVRELFEQILLREPSKDELTELQNYFKHQVSKFNASGDSLKALGVGNPETTGVSGPGSPDPVVAAATLTARVLLNTDEFINRN